VSSLKHLWISTAVLWFAAGVHAETPAASAQEVRVEIEAGAVFSARNDLRIPGDTGTKLSLTDDLSTDPAPVFRVRAGLRFAKRHELSALYAPLKLTASGSVDREILFDGGTYPAGSPILAVYRFDSYRLTYRYSLVHRRGLQVAIGLTGKIRRAETALYGAVAQRKTNTGFVPLASLQVKWQPQGNRFGLLMDVDALAAPQGRAEDVLLAATYQVNDNVGLRLGYRTLEGGADNDEVYTFAWLHYVVAGVDLTF
jgi:hypothetical protein